jgi:hypothetical protein
VPCWRSEVRALLADPEVELAPGVERDPSTVPLRLAADDLSHVADHVASVVRRLVSLSESAKVPA